jgi:hypothetical protein
MGRGPHVASYVPSHAQTAAKMQVFADSFYAAIDGSWTFVGAIDTTGASGATAGVVLDL